MIIRYILIVILWLTLTGCGSERIVNKIDLVHTIGYDQIGDNIKASILVGDYKEKETMSATMYVANARSELGLMPALNTKTMGALEYGQLDMLIFGKDYARTGVEAVMNNLCHDPKISTRMQLAVADREAYDLLKASQVSQNSFLLSSLLRQNMKEGNLPEHNFHIALYDYYGKGRDLFAPYLIMEQNQAKLDGLALFRRDKYITHISLNQALLLKLLLQNARNGSYRLQLQLQENRKSETVLQINSSKVSYKFIKQKRSPLVSIQLDITAHIEDMPQASEDQQAQQFRELENKVRKQLTTDLEKFIALCKDKRVDPMGLSDYVLRHTKQIRNAGTEHPAFTEEIHVNLNILETGYGQ
ncbi:Ger(x)C family spore germination protein [Paenibacillus swuensis]|nr:Ger(x)C family spore germination protein [Paenibacillus swuensis]